MASPRHDDLARRLAARMDKAPSKGRAMDVDVDAVRADPDVEPAATRAVTAPAADRPTVGAVESTDVAPLRPAIGPEPTVGTAETAGGHRQRPSRRRQSPRSDRATPVAARGRLRRGAPGTVLRGHLIPDRLHRDARRRKVELAARRGAKVTWDDVMSDAMSQLIDDAADIDRILDELGRGRGEPVRRRLVQATVPDELDHRFVLVHLELSERDAGAATFEQLWAAAVLLWLRSTE